MNCSLRTKGGFHRYRENVKKRKYENMAVVAKNTPRKWPHKSVYSCRLVQYSVLRTLLEGARNFPQNTIRNIELKDIFKTLVHKVTIAVSLQLRTLHAEPRVRTPGTACRTFGKFWVKCHFFSTFQIFFHNYYKSFYPLF